MRPRWLILADDLTGASDCAVAFAQLGISASVTWAAELPDQVVVALETDSRRLDAAQAAMRVRQMLDVHYRSGAYFFKKIDSTLRGQPAAELAGAIGQLRARGWNGLSVVAPAFPATGRSTREGRVHLWGQALEDTSLWARDHTYPDADMVAILEAEGLNVWLADLDAVRTGATALACLVREALDQGADVVVCDASEASDLDIIAQATVPLAQHLFWTGSGGLAQALARADRKAGDVCPEPIAVEGGILFVVGSVAEASRAASAVVAADRAVVPMVVAPNILYDGSAGPQWKAVARAIADTLEAGGDVLVEIAADSNADLSEGAYLVTQLGALLQPAAPHVGALFATGGETALALLRALGVTGVRLIEEIEAGVPLGLSQGALTIPVVTKAGAFGDAGTLHRCLSHLRRLRPTEKKK
jgi:uncharacterized protein YgbK (DUF1537 family)